MVICGMLYLYPGEQKKKHKFCSFNRLLAKGSYIVKMEIDD